MQSCFPLARSNQKVETRFSPLESALDEFHRQINQTGWKVICCVSAQKKKVKRHGLDCVSV